LRTDEVWRGEKSEKRESEKRKMKQEGTWHLALGKREARFTTEGTEGHGEGKGLGLGHWGRRNANAEARRGAETRRRREKRSGEEEKRFGLRRRHRGMRHRGIEIGEGSRAAGVGWKGAI
jgi:hypothetical protein